MQVEKYEGFKWIKVRKYTMDEEASWEERYKQLEKHHIEECEFLIAEVRQLAQRLDNARAALKRCRGENSAIRNSANSQARYDYDYLPYSDYEER